MINMQLVTAVLCLLVFTAHVNSASNEPSVLQSQLSAPNFVWSVARDLTNPTTGMKGVHIIKPAAPSSYTWDDNYLCSQEVDVSLWIWSSAGRPSGTLDCVQWFEPVDSSWSDNWLCMQYGSYFYTFSNDSIVPGMKCVSVDEPADPNTWVDNYFCSGTSTETLYLGFNGNNIQTSNGVSTVVYGTSTYSFFVARGLVRYVLYNNPYPSTYFVPFAKTLNTVAPIVFQGYIYLFYSE